MLSLLLKKKRERKVEIDYYYSSNILRTRLQVSIMNQIFSVHITTKINHLSKLTVRKKI